MGKYPIFLELSGRGVLLIGGGEVATRKAKVLLDKGADLVVISNRFNDSLVELCKSRDVEMIESEYDSKYLVGAILAIAATDDNELNQRIYKDCQELKVLCNVVDVPDLCDFYVPAVIKRGFLEVAVSTNGKCPAYSKNIRKILEDVITEKHGEFLLELECARKKIIAEVDDIKLRKVILTELVGQASFNYYIDNGSDSWHGYVGRVISEYLKS